MGDEETRKQHVLYGSAGMAASGMMPGARNKPRAVPDPEEERESGEEDTPTGEPVADEPPASAEEATPENKSLEVEEASPPAADESAADESAVDEAPAAGTPAAIIGHTGAGDFGNRLLHVFQRLDGVSPAAVADGNAEALEKSRSASCAARGYVDFRELLDKESPELVCIAPRWTDQRFEMIRAALEAGSHVLLEPPFCRTLREADELVELAAERNRRIAIAFPMRCDPHVLRFHSESEDLIGPLLEIRLFGRMDARAGGEDLLLFGSHLFDLARLFAGEPSYCTATITHDGVPAIAEDAHESEREQLGPLLGDSIRAEFRMESGVHVTFASDARLRSVSGPWGAEFLGEKGRMRLFANFPPVFSQLVSSNPGSHSRADAWQLWPQIQGPYHAAEDGLAKVDAANRRVVKDWLGAIGEGREPACSGENARHALEMVHGVWQAAVTTKRAYFPLVQRLHPLSEDAN